MTVTDPIAEYAVALDRALLGPRRPRRSMVAEARDGLLDAADAYREGGVAPERAATLAVRDFGPVAVVAPEFQDELTARQGRLTALVFAIVFPSMLGGWDLLWSTGTVRRDPRSASDVVTGLSVVQDVMTALVGVAALALLAVSFRRAVSPRRLTRAVGVTGAVGAVSCGGLAVAMNVAGGRSTLDMLATNPAAVAAFGGSGVVLVLIVWQASRALRVARFDRHNRRHERAHHA